jgi:hypothetical protein
MRWDRSVKQEKYISYIKIQIFPGGPRPGAPKVQFSHNVRGAISEPASEPSFPVGRSKRDLESSDRLRKGPFVLEPGNAAQGSVWPLGVTSGPLWYH